MPRKAFLAFAHPNVLGAPTYMVLALAQLDAQSAYMVRSIVFAIGLGNNGTRGWPVSWQQGCSDAAG